MDRRSRQEHAARSDILCWSRMQAEFGQSIEAIIRRKDIEREASGGIFCWGIGNAPPRMLPELARGGSQIDVVFSLMKSRPKAVDVAPDKIVVWRAYVDETGEEFRLPPGSLVTSRASGSGRAHYALICRSEQKLELTDFGAFDPTAYLNVSAAGRPVGASQVTALLRRVAPEGADTGYRANLCASLTQSLWVELADPLLLSNRAQGRLLGALQDVCSMSGGDWLRFVFGVKGEGTRRPLDRGQQLALL